MSRQFTDGEITAAIGRIAAEGAMPSRTIVRKRLGGGASSRIDALLKDFKRSGVAATEQPATEGAHQKLALNSTKQCAGSSESAITRSDLGNQSAVEDSNIKDSELIARLESEIRILQILLESERKARTDDATRHLQTIEALRHEIEVYRSIPRSGDR